LADMFFHTKFASEELQKEKNVVFEEIKMYEDTPDDIVHEVLSRAAYESHPLGYPILGTEETLKTFTRDKLKNYQYEMYTPDRIVISIAGNVNEDIIKVVEKLFGQYEGSKEQKTATKPTFMTNHLSRKKDIEQAHLC